jgi:membrane-associated phospholipid phosphatase
MTSPPSERILRFARLVSTVFNPLWLPLAVFGYAALRLESDPVQILWVLTIGSVFFVLIPWIILLQLKSQRKIDSIDVRDRVSRNLPYTYGLLSMGCGLIAFQYAPLNHNMIYIVLSIISINNTMIAALINLQWKISVHAMGMGTACTVLFFLSGSFPLQWPAFELEPVIFISLCAVILITVQYSRVKLQFHTPSQVIAGGILSTILTITQLTLFVSKAPTPILV